MFFFNSKNKSNNGVSEETAKAYWEWEKQQKSNLPSAEEAIDAIISVFTQEQLKVLEIKNNSGKTLTFKKQLLAMYDHLYPTTSIPEIKKITKIYIDECKTIFDHKTVVWTFLKTKFSELFYK